MKALSIFLFIFLFSLSIPSKPSIRYEDKIRIKEAFLIEQQFGEKVWKGFTLPPFPIVLVYDDYEFLINHPKPTDDFIFLENDSFLGVDVYYRKRTFNKHFLATFPAVNGFNCIVIGIPENTNQTSTSWIITLLHERFHQYQYTSKNYYQDTMDLGISNGDQTGMWQLNYPFPYEDKAVIEKYEVYANTLQKAVKELNTPQFKEYYKLFSKARKEFKEVLQPDDYKYFSFQLYQEGMARYTEYAFLETLKKYTPTIEVQTIQDFKAFNNYKNSFLTKHINNITALKLDQQKRVCFYDIGLGEALLINKVNPNWKDQYLLDKFDIEKFYPKN